jgi:hypothetical protein
MSGVTSTYPFARARARHANSSSATVLFVSYQYIHAKNPVATTRTRTKNCLPQNCSFVMGSIFVLAHGCSEKHRGGARVDHLRDSTKNVRLGRAAPNYPPLPRLQSANPTFQLTAELWLLTPAGNLRPPRCPAPAACSARECWPLCGPCSAPNCSGTVAEQRDVRNRGERQLGIH